MKNIFILIVFLVISTFNAVSLKAYFTKEAKALRGQKGGDQLELREICKPATSKVDLNINNVRARLLNGGDVWWDYVDGQYVVPNVTEKPVSSIFCAAVWVVGFNGGALKGAGRINGGSSGKHDWKPGPLNDETGEITISECSNWDRFFEVRGAEIDEHLRLFLEAKTNGTEYSEDQIPLNVRAWPATGNPYFKRIFNWSLPTTTAALAPFYDEDGDGFYDPALGDFPIIEIRGVAGACESTLENPIEPTYADQMYFWIYNDNAGPHSEFLGAPINMEVQVQAYAFNTTDQLNDMTFMRYKLVNRAPTVTSKCIFGWWVDSDLGCPFDDLVGCDSTESLVYYYNEDGTDGNQNEIQCSDQINTYGRQVPILGIDYFEGPTIDTILNGKETNLDIGMTSFTYFNNGGEETNMTDPGTLQELYNYMDAKWKNGTPFTYGGSGYNSGGPVTRYAFPNAPDDPNGWSMKTVDLPSLDRRTVQATGPIELQPGKTNYLVVGVPWVPNQDYSGPNNAPSLKDLLAADRICQGLFDNCFKIFDGPDAPDVDVIELDQKIIIALSNNPIESNNYNLDYKGFNPGISPSKEDFGLFRFQGYQVYQLSSEDVSLSELDDVSKARLVAQVDLKDTVTSLYNWDPIPNPTFPDENDSLHFIWIPSLKVDGENKGLRNTFEITQDFFGTGSQKLINHKKYYYTAVAYAYNNYQSLDVEGRGQQITFARGRGNSKIYQGIPRPIVDRVLNSDYGDGAVITRLDGVGNFSSFLELADGERERLFNLSFTPGPNEQRTIKYKEQGGPVAVKVFNPIDVIDGKLSLQFTDDDPTDFELNTETATWSLTDESGDTLVSAEKFNLFNERLIAEYGISIFFTNNDPGEDRDDVNGYIGQKIEFADASVDPWLAFLHDGQQDLDPDLNVSLLIQEGLNWIEYTIKADEAPDPDPEKVYESLSFWPIVLGLKDAEDVGLTEFLTPLPAATNIKSTVIKTNDMSQLNNVDIVFTSDRSKWSKCIVVETSNAKYSLAGYNPVGNASNFSLRRSRSITKEVDANGEPVMNTNPDSIGMSWFPGYAIDVETGVRLNIFFGENSSFDPGILGDLFDTLKIKRDIARDMLWNPDPALLIPANNQISPEIFFAGGHHSIYVTKTKYNECATFYGNLRNNPSDINKARVLTQVTWAGVPLPNSKMLSFKDGLIPQETVFKIRVNNSYQVSEIPDGRTGLNNGMPKYLMEISGKAFTSRDNDLVNRALDSISVVPNPYYAYSAYEVNEVSNIVKITNLPAKCMVTIYSLDGKFIRQFNRNEIREEKSGFTGVRYAQVTPDIEWDLKNSNGITVGSGIYLIHIKSDEGERVIKWVGAIRQLEISGF